MAELKITDDNYEEILGKGGVVVIDFWEHGADLVNGCLRSSRRLRMITKAKHW